MSRPRILLLLLVSLGLALTYAWLETPRLQRATDLVGANLDGTDIRAKKSSAAGSATVGLDFSGGGTFPYQKPKRDLFRPLYEKPLPVKQIIIAPPPPPPPPEPVIVRVPPPATVRPATLPRTGSKPIPPLKVLGYLQKGATQSAFLSSANGEIYVVKRGARFADDLLVRELTPEGIQISRDLTDKGITLYFAKENARFRTSGPLVSDRPIFTPEEEPQVETINPQMPLQNGQPIN